MQALHVTERGQGQPVVMLHSGGMSGRQWRRLGDALEKTHRVLAPDFLGSGDNPLWPSETPFDFSLDVDALEELLANAGPVHLVGHSYGGLIALTFARRHPERVRSLSVYDPVAFGVVRAANDLEGAGDLERIERDPIFVDDARGGDERWFELFVDYWNGPGAWKALPPPARDSFLRVGRKVFYEVRSLMRDRTPASAYAAISAPALLLGGEKSPAAARRTLALLASALPHATSKTIAGAGHMGPISHSDEVNAAIVAHVKSASV